MKTKSNIWIYLSIYFGVILLLADSCTKINPPTLQTIDISNLTYCSVTCGGRILSDGGKNIQECGICWNTISNPTIEDSTIKIETIRADSFSIVISGLFVNTPYYMRAYATNREGTSYGQEVTFTLWLNVADEPVKDIDNNTYATVKIGNQIWMSENLRVTHYQNGDEISNSITDAQWNRSRGSYCWYDNDTTYKKVYGALYSWGVTVDDRGLAPTGWHIPDKQEWITLINFLGGSDIAGNKLKESGINHWSEGSGADNYSGFTALPGGNRNAVDYYDRTYFQFLGSFTGFWSTYSDDRYAYALMLKSNESNAGVASAWFWDGFSVRCLKD